MNALPVIERDDLIAPFRRLVGRATAEPIAWQVAPLGGGFGNPVSLGLYRVSGQGHDGGRDFDWSLVLKMVQSPANVGMTQLGGGDDMTHWNYWRREALLHASSLLAGLPPGLEAPRCYGVAERPGDVNWLWYEEIVDSYGGQWPGARYGLAARHLGRLSGAYVSRWQAADYPWLGRALLRQFSSGIAFFAPWSTDAGRLAAAMQHPVFSRLLAPRSRDFFRICVLERERLLNALDRLPLTLGHQDAYPTNLMSRLDDHGQEVTVALDWGLAGVAPIGGDLAQLFIGLFENATELDPAGAERLVVDGYLQGLRDSGWMGAEGEAIFGFHGTTVFRIIFLLLFALGEPLSRAMAGESDEPLDTLAENLNRQARLLDYLEPSVAYLWAAKS